MDLGEESQDALRGLCGDDDDFFSLSAKAGNATARSAEPSRAKAAAGSSLAYSHPAGEPRGAAASKGTGLQQQCPETAGNSLPEGAVAQAP